MRLRLLAALAFTIPYAIAADAMDTDTVVGLVAKTNPKNLQGNNPQGFARTIFCNELSAARNDFDVHDAMQRVAARMKSLADKANPHLDGLARTFSFHPYDFNKQTLQINRGNYDWARTVPVANLLNVSNQPCWQNPGHMMGMPNIAEALPDWKQIPFTFNIPQDEARDWFQGGTPSASLTVSINVENYALEPMGSPKIIFRGQTTSWELVIYSGDGKEVRRLSSGPAQTSAAPESVLGQRAVIDTANVRAEPSTQSTILTRLSPGDHVTVEKQTADRQWSYVIVPDDAVGWVNTPVLLRTTRPIGTPVTTAALSTPKLSGDALQQKMLFLATGLDAAPYKEIEEFHNAHGNHIKTVTHTYEPSFEDTCKLSLRYTSATKEYGAPSGLGNYTVTRSYDFSKLDRIQAQYTEHPEEGIWWHFAGGPTNARLRKPRFITLVEYYGDGFECATYENSPKPNCTTGAKARVNYTFANAAKRPKHFQDAVKAVKAACQ